MLYRTAVTLLLASSLATAQKITKPQASYIDVPSRQAALATTTNPLLLDAIHHLHSCIATPAVPAPPAPIEIPHHYISGSNGPINPAEAVATRIYSDFERRITSGMNQYVATGSHAEATCALAQLDAWAQARALLDYDPKDSQQAWYQVEWTLAASGTTLSVLVNDPSLDPAQQKRVIAWLDEAAHKLLSFEKPGELGNNHHYYRALAAISIGIVASDNTLFHFALDTYKQAIDEIDPSGAFPREMARHEYAAHYQGFALQPLIPLAEFAERQGVDLYAYKSHGRTLRDAILFFGRVMDDPTLIKPYASEPQHMDFGSSDLAPFVFYISRFGPDGIPPALIDGLHHPTEATRIGGSTTVLAGK